MIFRAFCVTFEQMSYFEWTPKDRIFTFSFSASFVLHVKEHDPVYLSGKCTQTHIQYMYIKQTIENNVTPDRLLPLSTVHPSNDF